MHLNQRHTPEQPDGDNNLVYGRNAVLELLKSDRPVDVLYLDSGDEGKDGAYFAALAKEKGAVVKRVHKSKLEALCGDRRHQGVAASASGIDYKSVADMQQLAREKGEDLFLVIADGIEDPHNLGAIIRTAEAAGAHGLVLAKRGSAGITATVQRSSAGAVNHLAIARVPNLASVVRELKKDGVFCYCADMKGQSVYDTDLTGPSALVVGSEGQGVSRLLKDLCDVVVSLPMRGEVASLNASVAAGAVLYEMVRQREQKAKKNADNKPR